jgi:molybdenum cofactor biosynthesis enzyme MoaA
MKPGRNEIDSGKETGKSRNYDTLFGNGLAIIGGEPLLRTDLHRVIKGIRKDIGVAIDTNARNIRKWWKPEYTERISRVAIGYDGNDDNRKEVNEVRKAIKFLVSEGVAVTIGTMVKSEN